METGLGNPMSLHLLLMFGNFRARSGHNPGLLPLLRVTDLISYYSLTDSSQENFPHTSPCIDQAIKALMGHLLCARGSPVFYSPLGQFLD